MTSQSHTLPEDPEFAFCPAYDLENRPQQIRIVFSGMTGFVPTALVALSLNDAELLCDRLNARLGLDRDAWSALVGRWSGRLLRRHRDVPRWCRIQPPE